MWIGASFENTLHVVVVVFSVFYLKILKGLLKRNILSWEGTFVVLNIFLFKRPFKAILCLLIVK